MDNKQRIINCLGKNMERTQTMLELSKAAIIPYATFHRTIKDMPDLIISHTIGKSKTISLNKSHPSIRSYLAVSSEEQKIDFLKKHPIINKITSELRTKDIVILFGSYAKGTEKPSSDIDLLIINKKGDKNISFSKYETIFKRHINPIFITDNEFKLMLKDNEENIGKQALKDHIILNNPEGFWKCAIDG